MVQLKETALYRLLSTLGFYDLEGYTVLRGELYGYLAGINYFLEKLDLARGDSSVATCSQARLREWERALDIPTRPLAQDKARRDTVVARLALTPWDFTPAGTQKCLEAAGIRGSVREDCLGQKLVVLVEAFTGDYGSSYEVMETARRLLPAHMTVEFEIGGANWPEWEAGAATWAAFDSQDKSWQERDIPPQPAA